MVLVTTTRFKGDCGSSVSASPDSTPCVQYAITSLTKYTIAAVGLLIAASTLGISWAKVQWLVAAMTVGLGFGLQEIFANFVSGLIILFERPIRLGDTVTVGGVTGRQVAHLGHVLPALVHVGQVVHPV
ncbi:mechanosensitive ion channel, partial [Candidatus Bipolaricaulota bacterium]|nr:mechanosensitive ion channel [Candidatus Bipolaricaulota bacterium]